MTTIVTPPQVMLSILHFPDSLLKSENLNPGYLDELKNELKERQHHFEYSNQSNLPEIKDVADIRRRMYSAFRIHIECKNMNTTEAIAAFCKNTMGYKLLDPLTYIAILKCCATTTSEIKQFQYVLSPYFLIDKNEECKAQFFFPTKLSGNLDYTYIEQLRNVKDEILLGFVEVFVIADVNVELKIPA